MPLPTLPDGTPKPLEVNFDRKRMTLKEAKLLEGRSKDFSIAVMIEFLAKYSNWTEAEIGNLTLAELKTLRPKIRVRK